MKKQVTQCLEKASVNLVSKKGSFYFWGEREIPQVILDEIKAKKCK